MALVELRVLDGANLYFPRAAVKLTLDLGALLAAPADRLESAAQDVGLRAARPGPPGSGLRQRFAGRLLARLVRQVAAAAGTSRLAVRVRPTSDPARLVVAYPWRRRGTAQALGEQVAGLVDRLLTEDVVGLVEEAAAAVRTAEPGDGPRTIRPRVPVIAVTGTNGKTTTSRMVAHIARTAGLHVGWSSTDGVFVDGVLVEAGDYSGPSGAGQVLAHPVDLAVTETARGGILLKGIGVTHNDVSVVTNVSADHLGTHGIDTVDQLAEVKGVVPWITRPDGWAVLNAEDPRTLAMRAHTRARVWVFARDPDTPGVREVLTDGGRATTVIDGAVCVLAPGADPDPLLPVVDVPMTLAGLSRFNVENALAAASAALAVGLPRDAVVAGLRSFRPDPEHNPGRMNCFTVPTPSGSVTVVMDLAHNEVGLEAFLEILHGLRASPGRIRLGLGVVGDRTDDLITALGEIAARGADRVVIAHKEKYLRGRTTAELDALMRAGAAAVGVADVPSYDTELAALERLVAEAGPDDVVGLMCHAERQQCYDWIAEQGGTADTPEDLRAKVLRAQASGA